MPIHDTPRLQTATDTPADAHALRASLTALVQGGHGDDRLDLRPDGSFATTPASRPATGLVGRFKAAFRGLRDVFRRTPRTTEPPRASASFSTLHVLYEMARGRHGAGVADLAFVPTSLAQRSVAVGDPRDISVARAVQLLDSADQQADATRAANEARVDALLQPPGAALRDAIERAGGPSDPREGGFDPALNRFTDVFVRRLAEDHPEFRHRALTGDELADCCAKAAGLLLELGEVSGPELPALLDRVLNDTTASASSQGMAQAARAKVIEAAFDRMVAVDGDDSVLWNAVLEESAKLSQRDDPIDVGDTRMLQTVGKEISKEMKDDFTHRARKLVEHLGLPADTPVSRVLEHCHGRLVQNIQTAVREHFEALEKIATDKDLDPDQRQILQSLAHTRRVDPVQVDQLKRFGVELGKAIRAMGNYAARGRPEAMFDRLKIDNEAFGQVCGEIGRHAETMWVAHAFDDATARDELFGVGIELALAGNYADSEAARVALEALTGAGDAEADRGSSSDARPSPLATVQQVMQACDQAGSTQIGDMKARYAAIVIALARRAGVALDEVVEHRVVQVRKAAGIVEESVDVTREEQLMARIAGERLPLSALPLGILSETLLDVPRGNEAGVQANGVLVGGRAIDVVAADFDATGLFVHAAPMYATTAVVETAHGALAQDFVAAIGQLDIVIDRVPLLGTPEERVKAFFEKTSGSGDEETDRRVALEISRRMNPVAMARWTADLQHAAVTGRGASLDGAAPPRTAFELSSDEQGNWTLAGSAVSAPGTLAVQGGVEPVSLNGGVIVSRVRSVIPVSSILTGQPTAAPRDALVTFAF